MAKTGVKSRKPSFQGKEESYELFNQGKKPGDPEFKQLDIKHVTIQRYYADWLIAKEKAGPDSPPILPSPSDKTKKAAQVEVGKITINLENWGMTQYGAIIVLDTYERAKRDIEYGGTVGEFICDVFAFYRRIQNYTEVKYAGQESYGGDGAKEDG